MHKILIVGASIAGLSSAYWLAQYGFSVTIVELNHGLRRGGQAIDIRGPALFVIDQMGIDSEVRNFQTDHQGVNIVDADGKEIFRSEEFTFTRSRFDSPDIEILRDDLVDILASITLGLPQVSLRYDDTVEELIQTETGVLVTFHSGMKAEFWAVLGADGIYSKVRKLIHPGSFELTPVSPQRFAIWSTQNFINLQRWQTFFDPTPDIRVGVMTVKYDHELRAMAFFPQPDERYRSRDKWKLHLQKILLENPGWITADLAQTLEQTSDFYCDIALQVRLSAWNQAKVALVGDAAYCPSPYSGQGTSAALVGAYVLAGELALHARTNPEDAFQAYYKELAEYMRANQEIALISQSVPRESFRDNLEIMEPWSTIISKYMPKSYHLASS